VLVTAKRGGIDPQDGRFPLLIEVKDSGIGIQPGRVDRLFKPFSQADSSTTRRFGGTGLGLAICKRLAELLGGDVRLASSSSAGSVFALELPLVAVPPEGEQTAEANAAPGLVEEPVDSPQTSLRVLVVEDNPVNRMLAQRMLASLGFQCDAAENGLVGLQAHTRQPYNVIFMDLQMPVMDGVATAAHIRQRESETPGIRPVYIIALTADAMAGDRERCLAAGMNDYLSKPIRRNDLAEALEKAEGALSAPTA